MAPDIMQSGQNGIRTKWQMVKMACGQNGVGQNGMSVMPNLANEYSGYSVRLIKKCNCIYRVQSAIVVTKTDSKNNRDKEKACSFFCV